jgi:ATP synthase protein I
MSSGDDLRRAVRKERDQQEQHRREGERPLARNLALAGTIGWLIVLPALGGVLLGRWLDHKLGTGITLSAALLFVGLVWGSFLAWQRIHET